MEAFARILCVLSLTAFFSACGGGGGGVAPTPLGGAAPPPPPPPPPDVIIGGSVEAPNGQIAFHRRPSRPAYWLDVLMSAAHASVPGSSPVADGTPVDLVRLDDNGSVAQTLASTTTSGGRYSFNFTDLNLSIAGDLVVTAMGGAGIELRAFVSREIVNVDAESEATVSLVLDQLAVVVGSTISNFTLQEHDDLVASVRLSAMVNGVTAGPDVPSTVTSIRDSALSDPKITALFAAAAESGQTAAGPGDIGNFFPFTQDATWTFDGSLSQDGSPATNFSNTIIVDGTRDVNGTLTTVFIETNSSDSGELIESLLVKTDLVLSDWTEVETGGAALDLARFPLDSGVTLTVTDISLSLGEDLDGDGVIETVIASSASTVVGFEDLLVAGGRFVNAVRIESELTFVGTLSGAGVEFTGSGTVAEWFSAGVGEVRRDIELMVTSSAGSASGTINEELTGGAFTVARNIRSNQMDGIVIASDGTNYFPVTCRDKGAELGYFAISVPGSGRAAGTFSIGEPHYLTACQTGGLDVAFDGSNYLVVFAKTGPTNLTNVVATRVTPDGTVLDTPEIMLSSGSSNFFPAVAFDGSNYLVAWQKFDSTFPGPPGERPPGHEIYGARVSPAGVNMGEFALFTSPGAQHSVDLAFDGTNYLVAWRDTRTLLTEDYDIYGTRVSPAGVVLDAPAFGIVTAPGIQGAPQVASNGNNWLVAWIDVGATTIVSPPPDGRIFARRVAPDGSMLDGTSDTIGIGIGTSPVSNHSPTATYNGTNYFVAWAVGSYPNSGPAGIYGATVTGAGQLVGGSADTLSPSISGAPPNASQFVRPAVASNGQDAFVAWGHIGSGPGTVDILGNVIEP